MKTKVKAIVPTMALTLDDVIFSNRNQAYGAYYLRKKYYKHLFYALFFTTVVFVLISGYPLFKKPGSSINIPTTYTDTTVRTLDSITIYNPPPPIKNPFRELEKDIKNNGIPKPVESLSDEDTSKMIGITDDNATKNNNNDTFGSAYNNTIKKTFNLEDTQIYIGSIEEPATFNGGSVNNFRDWVQQNLVYPIEPLNSGISGKVFVKFIINTKGEISDVQILRGPHPSINDETVRVLLSSPKWQPARQNGHVVRQMYSIPVSFDIR